MPRHTAKFHLDELVSGGLLEVEFAWRTGRRGPGAGRPAKLYRRASREFALTLPERRYELAGHLMAHAITDARSEGRPVVQALGRAARDRGRQLDGTALQQAGDSASQAVLLTAARRVLDDEGYQTRTDTAGLTFANCPFHALAMEHASVVCGMNLAIVEGMLERLPRLRLAAMLEPAEGRCCVRLAAE